MVTWGILLIIHKKYISSNFVTYFRISDLTIVNKSHVNITEQERMTDKWKYYYSFFCFGGSFWSEYDSHNGTDVED